MEKIIETIVGEKIEVTKEVENMVRKAETLKSLDELNMPKRAKTYLMNKYGSLDAVIWYGRGMSYIDSYRSGDFKNKSTIELIDALDEAGLIRHDITDRSLCINRLYSLVYGDTIDHSMVPTFLDSLCLTAKKDDTTMHHFDYRTRNEMYENFKNPTEEQLSLFKQFLQSYLSETEYAVLAYREGLEDGSYHSLAQASDHFCVSFERIRQVVAKAIRKLRARHVAFPKSIQFSDSDELRAEIDSIVKTIEEIRKDPIFKKETELRSRLYQISKMPFEGAERATYYLGALDFSDIEQLRLSIRAYNCLKRANINTVADIIKLPKEDWPKVRNIRTCDLREIEEKIRAAGYADFSIGIPS